MYQSFGKTLIATLLFAAVCYPAADAAYITPDQALQRALDSKGSPARKLSAHQSGHMSLALACDFPGTSTPSLYGFSAAGGGYMIVTADDRFEPVLAYSTSGSLDPEAMPPQLQWWLGEYTRQLNWAATAATGSEGSSDGRPHREAIGPLVTTQWNQDYPYNATCPTYKGNATMTGCVATAMAQVMHYHRWPVQGTGSISYESNGISVSADFSKYVFDWDNMLDSYTGRSTDAQKLAVARLMFACGASTQMMYSPSSSGTADLYVAEALATYFGYDPNVRYAERNYYGLLEWEEFVYNQLRDFGPVVYSGTSDQGGHSFVCDGYGDDGFFHINWGWGGISDGYYRLTALNPLQQGIGGSTSAFNFQQAVIANISKPRPGSDICIDVMMPMGFTITPAKESPRPGDMVSVGGAMMNYTYSDVIFNASLKFTNDATGATRYGTGQRVAIRKYFAAEGYQVQIPSGLSTGTYTVTPALCGADGIWQDIPVQLSMVHQIRLTVKNGKCTFEPLTPDVVSVSSLDPVTPIYLGNMFQLRMELSNHGTTEVMGGLVPALYAGSDLIAMADPVAYDLLPGAVDSLTYTGIFNHFATTQLPDSGSYTLYVIDEQNRRKLSEGIGITLHGLPEEVGLTLEKFGLDGDVASASRDNLRFRGTVGCSEGFFGASLSVVIFPYSSGTVESQGYFSTPYLFVDKGESADFEAGGAFAAGVAGNQYFAVVFDGQTQLEGDNFLRFTIAKSGELGVEGIAADSTGISVTACGEGRYTIVSASGFDGWRVYSASGQLMLSGQSADVDLTPLPAGLYILATGRSGRPASVHRLCR